MNNETWKSDWEASDNRGITTNQHADIWADKENDANKKNLCLKSKKRCGRKKDVNEKKSFLKKGGWGPSQRGKLFGHFMR